MAPQEAPTPRDPANLTRRLTAMTIAHPAPPAIEEQDHPHACMGGLVYLGYTAVDEETGEELERIEALPCRRCAEEAR
jgi:hypothetical protein